MTTRTRLLAVLTAGILTLGLTACGGDDQDSADPPMTDSVSQDGPAIEGITDEMRNNESITTGPEDVAGPIPVVTLPFLEADPISGTNTIDITCPFGGRADIATPAEGRCVVTPDTDYDYELIMSDRPASIPVPDAETSVIQVTPDMQDCTVSAQAGAVGSLGDYTVSEATVFAISVPRK